MGSDAVTALRIPNFASGSVVTSSAAHRPRYPRFEMTAEDASPRFLCDAMLGSLARWLRFCGYDCLYLGTESEDAEGDSRTTKIRLSMRGGDCFVGNLQYC